jgi:hypothetical protein
VIRAAPYDHIACRRRGADRIAVWVKDTKVHLMRWLARSPVLPPYLPSRQGDAVLMSGLEESIRAKTIEGVTPSAAAALKLEYSPHQVHRPINNPKSALLSFRDPRCTDMHPHYATVAPFPPLAQEQLDSLNSKPMKEAKEKLVKESKEAPSKK